MKIGLYLDGLVVHLKLNLTSLWIVYLYNMNTPPNTLVFSYIWGPLFLRF